MNLPAQEGSSDFLVPVDCCEAGERRDTKPSNCGVDSQPVRETQPGRRFGKMRAGDSVTFLIRGRPASVSPRNTRVDAVTIWRPSRLS